MDELKKERHWLEKSRYSVNTVDIFTPNNPETFSGKSTITSKRIDGPYVEIDTSNDEYGSVLLSIDDVRFLLSVLEEDEKSMRQLG